MKIGIVRLWNLYINAARLANEQSLIYFIIIELLVVLFRYMCCVWQ